MSNWEDATNYNSRYEKGSRHNPETPTAWRYKSDMLDIHLLSAHINCPGEYAFHCRVLNMDTISTGMTVNTHTPEQAQNRTVALIKHRLDRLQTALPQSNADA